MINWRMNGAQFGGLWLDHRVEGYPFPFQIVTGYRSVEELTEFHRSVREAFAGPAHDSLRAAVRVLAEPEVHVAVSGRTIDAEPLRLIAAQVQSFVALAVQLPGPGPMHGGDVVVAYGTAGRLGGQIVGALPANAAGRRQFAPRAAETEPEHDYSASVLSAVATAPARPRLESAIEKSHAGDGVIRVWSGLRHERGREVGTVKWIDLAGDGRYAIGPRDRNTARPAGPDTLAATVDAMIREGLAAARDEFTS